jgi:outer membrane protein
LELIATNPQKHTVYLSGNRVGTLRHLPPTLTAQYHFAPTNPTVRPYVGLGVNYTHLSAVNVSVASDHDVTLDKSSWGLAYNVGANFPINDKLSFNVDFKKIDIQTEAKLNGTKIGTVKVNPVLFGVGVGYKF